MFNFVKIIFGGLFTASAIAFLIFLASVNLGITLFFLVVIFFITNYFLKRISRFKKQQIGLEHLLQANEKKFKNSEIEKNIIAKVFTNFDQGVVVIGENGKVFMANPLAEKILQAKSENAMADFLSPYFSSLGTILKEEIILNNFNIELSAIPLVFGQKDMGKLIILRDIAKEKLLEKVKTDSILSAVHQLKTSVTSAKWSLKMFLSGDFGKLSKEQKEVTQRLYGRNDSSLFLIDNLFYATKIDNKAYRYAKTLVDITQVVQAEINYFQDKIKSKKIKVQFKKPAESLPKIMADKEKIESVIKNLFDNALKYTPAEGTINARIACEGKKISFKIKDSGIGIPLADQSKIFGKFFRARNANKIEANGSGLGLFIAKKIIEDHNGSLSFQSEENKGTEFLLDLPLNMV